MSYFTQDDLYHFNAGTATRVHDRLGAHLGEQDGKLGCHFALWAPGARSVHLVGDFSAWNPDHAMVSLGESGIWYLFVPGAAEGALYKYRVQSQAGHWVDKSDPVAFSAELAPHTASRITSLAYSWHDQAWMQERGAKNALAAPISIYELHLGSWRRKPNGDFLSYSEVADQLVPYLVRLGFTHVEFMPLSEHPFYGSWGYQVTGYFAASSRYGSPQELMLLIDSLHQAGIGVIVDWVPAHFPTDAHGLGNFDGTHLYEHADPRAGFHPDWNTYIFNYGRHEVRSFLISSALFWLDRYHVDALRVDGVASMLYLDYSREDGEWLPNRQGGNHNLEAIAFLQQFNCAVYREFPDVQTIAEESTAFPQVSRPVHTGGLGFGFKWDMGWMHDSLEFFARDPIHRGHHLDDLSKRALWAFSENFMLPLSHDEVVHGKGSLLSRMPGDEWQKFANLRLLIGHMFGSPGKKLLFMGCEFAQWQEWNHESELEWLALTHGTHQGMQTLVTDLNALYRKHPCMHQLDCHSDGFTWIHTGDRDNAVMAYLRKDSLGQSMLVLLNLTPIPRDGYRVGVPRGGEYLLELCTDHTRYGGGSELCTLQADSSQEPWNSFPHSLVIDLPALSISFWRRRQQ